MNDLHKPNRACRSAIGVAVFTLALVVLVAACKDEVAGPATDADASKASTTDKPTVKKVEPVDPSTLPDPMIPDEPQAFPPTFARTADGGKADLAVLQQVDKCGECHAEIVSEWRQSVHAMASLNNPFYRNSFDTFQKEHKDDKTNFCAGCHDPLLMFDGTITRTVEATEPRAHAGITCNVCHGVVEADTNGNGSWAITTSTIPFPEEGDGYAATLDAHKKRVASPALRSEAFCVTCHVGFISPATGNFSFGTGLNEFKPWRHSSYNGSFATRIAVVENQKTCVDCHMARATTEDGKSYSTHRFLGGHTALAAAAGADEQVAALSAFLEGIAEVRLFPMVVSSGIGKPVEASAVKPGDKIWIDAVVSNTGVGHTFPGGAKDLRDTWVEVAIADKSGKDLAGSGRKHAEGFSADAHRLRAEVVDSSGKRVPLHEVARFRLPAYDHTINPGDSKAARVVWDIPQDLAAEAFPLTVTVRLRHRRLVEEFRKATCEESKTERGAAFRAATKKHTGFDIDPCRAQPIVDITTATLQLGAGAEVGKASWVDEWRHGQALSKQVSERLDEARLCFESALKLLPRGKNDKARALVLVDLAKVVGRQGRTDDAVKLLDEANTLVPNHPSIGFARGEVNARVWRWEKAAAGYRSATKGAPDDARTWQQLAIALGSLGRHDEVLPVAHKGLALEPRDASLLRSQMLALQKLAPGSDKTKAARKAFLEFKRDEGTNTVKGACSDSSPDCKRERLPVHEHPLEPGL